MVLIFLSRLVCVVTFGSPVLLASTSVTETIIGSCALCGFAAVLTGGR